MNRPLTITFRLGTCVLAAGIAAVGSATVLVDRGLPTDNLNNAAGANRSNVAWAMPVTGFTGDDFTLPTAAPAYSITGIRTWLVTVDQVGDQTPFASLISSLTLSLNAFGAGNTVAEFPYGYTATRVTYPSSSVTYEGFGGVMRSLWQIDWDTSGLTLGGGQKFNFGVSGTTVSGSTTIFNHASNAALGGSAADGADNRFSFWDAFGEGFTSVDSNGNRWDKSSDINVVVTGEAVPEPATLAALGIGALAMMRRKRQR